MIIGLAGAKGSGKDTVAHIINYLHMSGNLPPYQEFMASPAHRLEETFEIKKFAYPVKQIACIILGCDMDTLEEDRDWREELIPELSTKGTGKSIIEPVIDIVPTADPYTFNLYQSGHSEKIDNGKKMTPRKLMQLIGTEFGREMIHPDIWVHALMNQYRPMVYESPELASKEGLPAYEIIDPKWIISDVRFENEAEAVQEHGMLIWVERPGLEKNDSHASENSLSPEDCDLVIENDGSVDRLVGKVEMALELLKEIQP
ncbi:hypothetical protein PP178_04070 [Zeaxanthinibacter sp. PT1]|uniref:deoxynucleotide monophosphate kinase family protein n=1 Tax=Zeaxanthinibacter TaxID=561554 RepID=UPI0023492BA4|nr:hypothetical protein [Zeaxanthinibacter sp. PT1]MDC6350717.1 hypothetical protein [Zeaxanthinibacter sp. PT1]